MASGESNTQTAVSVIVPVYNAEKCIEKTVRSVLDQTIKDIEVILVDDCSADDSFACCNRISSGDHRVKVYRHTVNRGVSAARNTGLSHASGKYVLFVDGDDILDEDMIAVLIGLMEEENRIDLAVCGFYINDIPQYGLHKEKDRIERLECARGIAGVGGSLVKGYAVNKLFKRKIIVDNHLKFDEDASICEDALFCYQYVWYCDLINYDPVCKYHYIIHSGSATHGKVTPRRMSVINTYRKIIEIGKKYEDPQLDRQLEANYLNHYVSLLKDIVKHSSDKQREYGDRLYSYLRANKKKYRASPCITLKRKALFTILYILYPVWRALPDRGSEASDA